MPSVKRKPKADIGGMLKTGFMSKGEPSASTSHGMKQGGPLRGGTPTDLHIKAGKSTANQGGNLRSGFPTNFGIKGSGGPGRPSKGPKGKKMY